MRFTAQAVSALVVVLLGSACGDTEPVESSNTTTSGTTFLPPTGQSSTTTRPVQPQDELLVVGDWGSGTSPQRAVADAMLRYSGDHDVEAILTTGDNFYGDNRELLMEPFGWATEANIPFWITWGNHDIESELRIDAVNEAFGDPPRWAVYQWGEIDVIVLDSNQIMSAEQAGFFLSAMGASERPTIIAMHHPPYSCAHHEAPTDLVNQVVEVLDDDVILVLSGHDHVYQRFQRDGISYVVTGGGGATVYELSECPVNHPEPLAEESVHHFVALEHADDAIVATAINVSGDIIDEFAIELP
ncbi:MAG TPA: metallophosphoesterase [Acidimicrobiia bacterium]